MRRPLHHGHLGPEAAHHLRELQTDVAAADDDQMFGHAVQLQNRDVVECGHGVDAGDIRAHRAAAHVQEDARCRQAASADFQRRSGHEAGLSNDDFGFLQAPHPGFESFAGLADDAVFAGLDTGHVHPELTGIEAEFAATARQVHGARARNEGLRRYAADVETGAPEVPALDDGGAQALLAAACGDGRTCLTGPNNDGVEGFTSHG
ncbi:hypothetical protein FQZ97_856100 [compost metagenome]